jgi:hypothetical protein
MNSDAERGGAMSYRVAALALRVGEDGKRT